MGDGLGREETQCFSVLGLWDSRDSEPCPCLGWGGIGRAIELLSTGGTSSELPAKLWKQLVWVGWRFDIQSLVTLGESLTHSVPDSVSSFIKRGEHLIFLTVLASRLPESRSPKRPNHSARLISYLVLIS